MNLIHKAGAFLSFLFAANLANAKLNVLLIVCDDLNTHVSTSGYPHINTPHLDRLSKESLIFNRAYCQYPRLRAVSGVVSQRVVSRVDRCVE